MYARTLYHNVKTTSLDDRLNLAFSRGKKGRFVRGSGGFVSDRLSY